MLKVSVLCVECLTCSSASTSPRLRPLPEFIMFESVVCRGRNGHTKLLFVFPWESYSFKGSAPRECLETY